MYRGSSPYANFITAIFQNFPKIFGLCDFMYYLFCYCDFYNWLMRFYVLFISLLRSICLMRFLANATFSQSQKSHKARTLGGAFWSAKIFLQHACIGNFKDHMCPKLQAVSMCMNNGINYIMKLQPNKYVGRLKESAIWIEVWLAKTEIIYP